ncbi:efflux RND transporter permease subunit [Roseibacillus ishigakijimensis]|uniref:Efflux RND transporter permease subunit n=1 Tax=Roseibacillus ishigakijimensis TaxID=454146 RepID=A0A934RP00_9BACT|nr:efflux RND transporter permease subunit [Roseibacillus ishigakijimensis]MBK1834323.1 efflux RND transporter permease subunit [Roseibacillus ishigakijimensis]
MLNHLIRFSLHQRALVLAVAGILLLLGIQKARQLPVEVLPDLTKPTVTILVEAPGYAPEEVETLITVPMESALMGVTGVTRLRSVNDISLSLIFVEFEWGTDIYDARQFVTERLSGAADFLPEGVTPYMTPVSSLMGDIGLIGLRDPTGKTSPRELRELADWVIARRLQSIPGIAEVLNMGGGVKQIQVQPQPEKMRALDVSYEELRRAAENAVSNTTGGFLTERATEIMVRNLAMTTDLSKIAKTVVKHEEDRAILLSDVAEVTWDLEPMRGDAGFGVKGDEPGEDGRRGDPGVILTVRKSPGFDTIDLTEKVEVALAELQSTLPPGAELRTLYRQREFIDLSIGNLEEALRDGAIMVSLILLLFLLNLRVTLITLTAIPLSLGITILIFDLMNLSVNSMTLGGLAVAIGMVVDDAIVDVENVFRRLRENAGLVEPLPKIEVIARASAEVRSSILYATILIILVFVPLLALSGVEGRLFAPIAIATMISMAASFVVSLTVIPVLSSYLLNPKAGKEHHEVWMVRFCKWLFRTTWLRFALAQPLLLFALIALLLVMTGSVARQMGGNFLPAFREPTMLVATTMAPGTSLKTTVSTAQTAQGQLLSTKGVETVGYRVGRAERGDHVVPVSTIEFDIEFDDYGREHRDEVSTAIRETMADIPGTFSAMSTPLADRIGHMLSGVSAKVAVKIFGPDLDELRRLGDEVVTLARDIPGLDEARPEQQGSVPQLRIEIDRDRAAAYGVTPGELNNELAELLGGGYLGEIYENQRVYDLVVRLPLEWRENPDQLAKLYIDTLSGRRIPLGWVADIRQASGPNTILRENTRRRFVVSINPTTSDLNAAVEELQATLSEKLTLPTGYSISFEGEYQAQQEARRTIMLMSLIILAAISFLLLSYFRSVTFVLLVLTNIPISLIGGVWLTRYTLDNISIATLVGFIAISGIAARNSIMMISHYLHLMRHEGEGFNLTMVVRGTEERLVPVLMTALSAGIALLPLVIAADEPGKEILNPVAIVIVGGLVSSTLLGLALTPAFFLTFGRKAAERSLANHSPASQ